MKQITSLKNYRLVILAVLFCLLLVWLLFPHSTNQSAIQYIQAQEKKPVDGLKKQLRTLHQNEVKQMIDAGQLDVFSLFDDYVLLGDSRVVGFYLYDFLPQSRVMAGAGYTIKNIDESLTAIKNLNPSKVYLSYGVNDIGLGLNNEAGGYESLLTTQVKKIQKELPKATIYLNSIIAVQSQAISRNENWKQVDVYNQVIKKVCQKNGWVYIDNSALGGDNANIYQPDGIHFTVPFYTTWAANMIAADDQ